MNSKISSTITIFVICMSLSDTIMAQRPSFAGPRPQSGYKDRFRTPTEASTQEISNRFGEDLNRPQVPPSSSVDVVRPASEFVPINNPTSSLSNQNTDLTNRFTSDSGITERLPYDALGDKELVKYYNTLPEDQRPFWLINAKAIEAHRNGSAGSRNTNVLAERGSFAGPAVVNNRVIQQQQRQPIQQNQQQSQQERIQQDIQQDERQIQLLQFQLQQQRQLDQQQQLQRQIQELQQRLQQRQSSNGLSSRGDFGSLNTGSNFVSNLRPSQNQISNSANILDEVDSKGGRFVYVDANLYKILKQNNLVV